MLLAIRRLTLQRNIVKNAICDRDNIPKIGLLHGKKPMGQLYVLISFFAQYSLVYSTERPLLTLRQSCCVIVFIIVNTIHGECICKQPEKLMGQPPILI